MALVHKVVPGDSTTSIGFRYGFFPKTLWDLPDNAALKKLRKDPDVLFPGDVVHVPDKQVKEVDGAINQTHRFRRKGVPAPFRVRLLKRDGTPYANEPYELRVDETTRQGKTDADGYVAEVVSPDARQGRLTLTSAKRVYWFGMGELNPIETVSGLQARLNNLGFTCPRDGKFDAGTREAVKRFQKTYGLPIRGEVDAATRQKLFEVHNG